MKLLKIGSLYVNVDYITQIENKSNDKVDRYIIYFQHPTQTMTVERTKTFHNPEIEKVIDYIKQLITSYEETL